MLRRWSTRAGALLLALVGCRADSDRPAPPDGDSLHAAATDLAVAPEWDARVRDEALAHAQVWRAPAAPVGQARLGENPPGPGAFAVGDELTCRFLPRYSQGRTPKFQCVLPGGDVIKVKYGHANRERQAELAGTRLARALGFGADRMYAVRRVRCWGCPAYPYPKLPWLDAMLADYRRPKEFEHVVVERPVEGIEIRTGGQEGWSWPELDKVDEKRGGAPRAQLDGLRLFAVFLNHWDSKPENQKLLCLPGGASSDGGCALPFAFIADFGATFGPRRAELAGWTAHRVWDDAATCSVSLRDLPYRGGGFPDRRISEGGRRLLAALLTQLRPEQVRDLFRGALFAAEGPEGEAEIDRWVSAFEERVREIAERGEPCPGP